MHFQISLSLWQLQVIRDLLCVRDIAEKSLNKLLLLVILKSSHRSGCSVEKCVLKNFANFTRKQLCWSLVSIKLEGLQLYLLKRDSNAGVFEWNLWNFWKHLFWRAYSSVKSFKAFLKFCKKVLSKIFEIVLNTPLSF